MPSEVDGCRKLISFIVALAVFGRVHVLGSPFALTIMNSVCACVYTGSDYDTFPLNHFLYHGRDLPYNGMFTVYNGFVPSLVSGNVSDSFSLCFESPFHHLKPKFSFINSSKEKRIF